MQKQRKAPDSAYLPPLSVIPPIITFLKNEVTFDTHINPNTH